jgi:hypothetical protein
LKVSNIAIAFGADPSTNRTIATLDTLDGGQHAHLALLMGAQPQSDSISWQGPFERAPDLTQFDPAIFTQDDDGEAAGIYQRNCDLALRRGLYMERGTIFAQLMHGVVSVQMKAVPRDEGAASIQGRVVHSGPPKTARDPRCVHSDDGMSDLSAMTPFVADTAKPWNINF